LDPGPDPLVRGADPLHWFLECDSSLQERSRRPRTRRTDPRSSSSFTEDTPLKSQVKTRKLFFKKLSEKKNKVNFFIFLIEFFRRIITRWELVL
jgi:hypothetical protein